MARAALTLITALLAQLGGCGILAGHALSRELTEEAVSGDYVVSVDRAEAVVREVYKAYRIAVDSTERNGETVIVVGRDSDDLGIKTRIRPLKNDVVRVSHQAGSFFGTVFSAQEEHALEAKVYQALAQRLQNHRLGG